MPGAHPVVSTTNVPTPCPVSSRGQNHLPEENCHFVLELHVNGIVWFPSGRTAPNHYLHFFFHLGLQRVTVESVTFFSVAGKLPWRNFSASLITLKYSLLRKSGQMANISPFIYLGIVSRFTSALHGSVVNYYIIGLHAWINTTHSNPTHLF